MNDQRSFERALADRMEAERRSAQLPDAFYDDFQTRAGHTRQRPRWLALIKEPPMRISSSLAVGSPMARVAAIIVATLLLAVLTVGAGVAGSQLLAQETDSDATFPTGTFVASEWSDRYVEFHDDGTCYWAYTPGYQDGNCTYTVDGDLFTETSMEEEWVRWDEYEPLTYRWDYDGEYLTFQPDDTGEPSRESARYLEQPYRFVPDPRLVVFADYDIEAGTELLAGHTDLRVAPSADMPEDALDDQDLATGRIAAVDIARGQPITLEMISDG